MKRKVKSTFKEPDTQATTMFAHKGMGFYPIGCGECDPVPCRIVREKDWKRILKLARGRK